MSSESLSCLTDDDLVYFTKHHRMWFFIPILKRITISESSTKKIVERAKSGHCHEILLVIKSGPFAYLYDGADDIKYLLRTGDFDAAKNFLERHPEYDVFQLYKSNYDNNDLIQGLLAKNIRYSMCTEKYQDAREFFDEHQDVNKYDVLDTRIKVILDMKDYQAATKFFDAFP